MLSKKFKILSWNIRGLGNDEKCRVVQNTIKKARCDVVLFQETKCNRMDLRYILRFLPSFFSTDVVYNLALNSAGGTLIAWRRSYQLINAWGTRHTVTVMLRQAGSGQCILITNAYGPSQDSMKPDFVKELAFLSNMAAHPWILAGDFNLVRWMTDRSSCNTAFTLMDMFNRFIAQAGIVDIPLRNRTYTWSSRRPQPSFSKLDRIFLSQQWTIAYPVIHLEALENIVSDHTPLVLTCKGLQQKQRRFQMELFWLKYHQPKLMVQRLWGEEPAREADPLHGFHQKTQVLHRALTIWQQQSFGFLDRQLDFCKRSILFFDRIEEKRNLLTHEFSLRQRIRERAFQLANNLEMRWKQRSRCNWIKNGDRNTKFFHAFASSRLRRNLVLQIEVGQQVITDGNLIKEAFLKSMEEILGKSESVLPFRVQSLYPTNPDLGDLQSPFCMEEVQAAVFQLANNKASGPDGLPSEFLKTYWLELKSEIFRLMLLFFHNDLNLNQYNEANIVMIPKTDMPKTTSDFRPISVINLIPKLITKILSNRLRAKLPDLISSSQTAFIRGRQISENFVATRETLHHIMHEGKPAIFIKIDFKKAFDSIEWPFLIRVMEARGFPMRWINWMRAIWSSSTSKISINGEYSRSFTHKRGLRQGDPLSPMLFNVAVDIFQRMVQTTSALLQLPLSRKIEDSILAFQYADDTAIIANASVTSLIAFKIILRLFTKASGLQINFAKSTFIPLNVPQQDLHWVSGILGCTQTAFPTTYLGMPLTIKAPVKEDFLPLIERIEKRLAGWQAKLLSRGGRLELVHTVLSTIPTYHMICFKFPKWVIKRIDKVRRNFLWGKSTNQVRGISLCNWPLVCLPKPWGGLGLLDLELRNISLLMRWWWKGYKEPTSLWTVTITNIHCNGANLNGPMLWTSTGSFFWGQLVSIKHFFDWATTWSIGDGRLISYWYDSWGPTPLAKTGSRQIGQLMSLRQARVLSMTAHEQAQPFPELSDQMDLLTWRFTANGQYSAASIYQVLISGGLIRWEFKAIWRYNIPPTVKVFIFLLLKDRLLTREVMIYRNFNCTDTQCPLCDSGVLESAVHLFFECPVSRAIWNRLSEFLGVPSFIHGDSVQKIWRRCSQLLKQKPSIRRRGECILSAGCWMIWRRRNTKIFEQRQATQDMVMQWIMSEATVWENNCGRS